MNSGWGHHNTIIGKRLYQPRQNAGRGPFLRGKAVTAIERLYFEDVAVGDQFVGATVAVEREELLWFARNFDNQPMHTDPAAARAMGLEDIIAPGCYTFALNSKSIHVIWNRLHFLPSGRDIALCLLKPLYAGGTLTTYVEIGGKRESSKPVRGWLDAKVTCRDDDDRAIATVDASWLLKRR